MRFLWGGRTGNGVPILINVLQTTPKLSSLKQKESTLNAGLGRKCLSLFHAEVAGIAQLGWKWHSSQALGHSYAVSESQVLNSDPHALPQAHIKFLIWGFIHSILQTGCQPLRIRKKIIKIKERLMAPETSWRALLCPELKSRSCRKLEKHWLWDGPYPEVALGAQVSLWSQQRWEKSVSTLRGGTVSKEDNFLG